MPAAGRRTVPIARRDPSLAPLLLTALVLLLGVVGAVPASAHDRLLGSDPADAAVVERAPASVVLTFNADQLPVGAAVVVRDAAGADRADGDPVVDGATVTQALQPGLPAGAYTVQWRSVSGDGHPIEGTFGFEVAAGAAPPDDDDDAPAPAATSGPTAGADDPADESADDPADDSAGGDASAGATPDDPGDGAAPSSTPVLLAVGLGAAAAAAAVVLVLRRRRSDGTAP